ncbi:tryptophan-rich sensory protein [Paenibacillus agricola]|uniref:Tryptophan-rich sensory protein n=1 Tax=Paenibacillus agricola TaxID=2716264 RepID=A0ABX0J2R8_9BACL|nr:tryptophan-rich sensory protein [Paenibacillus agricola]NHN29419.1 tryptophan-rich sensory protein [Paenibacillus agricola]
MTNAGYRWLNALALIAVLFVNWLANALPINGLTTGQVSAMFPVQITPAPYVFSIWGLIYAFLVGFAIIQFLPSKREHEEIRRIGPWFIISCVLNMTWIVVWQYLFTTTSIFVMLGILITLIVLYVNTRPYGWSSDLAERWFVQIPFSIYLGWISVATIVNAAAVLYDEKWSGFGLSGTTWTLILIMLAVVITVIMGISYRDPAFVAVTVWALIGIGVANSNTNTIVYSAWGAAAGLFLLVVWLLFAKNGLISNNRRARI